MLTFRNSFCRIQATAGLLSKSIRFMATTKESQPSPKSQNIVWSDSLLSSEERAKLTGCKGATIWLTGLSGSGKSTIGEEFFACIIPFHNSTQGAIVEKQLIERGYLAYRMDGDNLRHGLNRDLGFSMEDRTENIRRIAEVAKLFTDAGVLTVTSFISPYRRDRDAARATFAQSNLPFFEVFVKVPLEVAEQRDPKGLYKKARAGQLKGFTGIDDPYEEPVSPDLLLLSHQSTAEGCADQVLAKLEEAGVIPPAKSSPRPRQGPA